MEIIRSDMTLYYHAILPLYVETAELENPSDYTESTKYLSWERYFTHVLEEHTKGTELEYHKKKLNKQYLYARAMKILSKFLLDSNINFDRCMV